METLFSNYQLNRPKLRSERGELVAYFVGNLKNKNGKPFLARMIAFKISHIPTKDLYYFKSCFQDILNRQGVDAANKYFWWSIKAK